MLVNLVIFPKSNNSDSIDPEKHKIHSLARNRIQMDSLDSRQYGAGIMGLDNITSRILSTRSCRGA